MAFELAKRLRRAPRQIAQEIATELAAIPGVARVELAGAGYVNFFFDRAAFFAAAVTGRRPDAPEAAAAEATRRNAWSSTPTSIPIRPRISAICAMPRWAIRLCGCCGAAGAAWRCRTTSTTPACRWRTWWSAFQHLEKKSAAGGSRAGRGAALRLSLLGPLCARHAIFRGRQDAAGAARPDARGDRRGTRHRGGTGGDRLRGHRALPSAHDGAAGRASTTCCRARAKSCT